MTSTKSYNPRAIALDAIMLITSGESFSHIAINAALDKYSYIMASDKAFIVRLIHGTIEYIVQEDYIINRFSKTKTDKLKPVIKNILRMSIYQILYMDRVPDSAACDEAVKLTIKRGLRGLSGYVNGVLRSICRSKDSISFDTISLRYSMPEWITKLFVDDYGEDKAKDILASFLNPRPLCVRINKSKITPDEAIKLIEKECKSVKRAEGFDDILFINGIESIRELLAFKEGYITVQDISASFVCRCAGISKNDKILDICAAPGGKSLHALDILDGSGFVTACDISKDKCELIKDNIARCHFDNARVLVADATTFNEEFNESFDIVIADVPCSGLGVIGSKPDIKYRLTKESLDELIQLQRGIICQAVNYVKTGGRLIYSTCTLNKGENESERAYILENFNYKPFDISSFIPDIYKTGTEADGYTTLLPQKANGDGFFVSAYTKVG